MKKILFAALAVFALASCAKDVATDVQEYAIDFSSSAKGAVRSTVVDNTNFKSFKVWAYNGGTTIMDEITVSRENVSSDWTYSPKKYWPTEGTVDFYGFYIANAQVVDGYPVYQRQYAASSNGGLTFDVNVGATDDVVRTSNIPDAMYAVALDKSKTSGLTNNKVEMNFRHAMAQVDFQIKNATTSGLGIKIHTSHVYIDGLYSDGRYTTSTTASTTATTSAGSWDFSNFTPVKYWFHGDGHNVSASNSVYGSILSGTCLVFPQTKSGATVEVPCKISQNGVIIFDGVKTATLNIDWKEGKKYIYTLLFDDESIDNLSDTIEFTTNVVTITTEGKGTDVRPN